MYWRLLLCGLCLLLLLPACQPEPGDGKLTVVFPLETTELAGGQLLRVTITLMDNDGQPVEGAVVQAELRAPDGSVFTTIRCADTGQGRYLADYVTLSLRGAGGEWRVVARATWDDGKQAQAERTFKGLPSFSDEIQSEFGFWIEPPNALDCGYRYLRRYPMRYEDGSGWVIISNNCHGIVNMEIHWRRADFPADEAAAIAHAQYLADSAQSDLTRIPDPGLVAEQMTFKGYDTWHVTGRWKSTRESTGLIRKGPIEWMIFRCPNSDWLWTLVILTSSEKVYMDASLRPAWKTFECPTAQ
ncbi:MAG: hypothetical protein KKA73_11500 [Chloroflexi bacterium]|nr:hypothetical protein [Chloroflexota bacterium]MBU1748304.1 hypothetical protein [Chloroflexota bacterium]